MIQSIFSPTNIKEAFKLLEITMILALFCLVFIYLFIYLFIFFFLILWHSIWYSWIHLFVYDFFTKRSDIHNYHTRFNSDYKQPGTKIFTDQAVRITEQILWNALNDHLKNVNSIKDTQMGPLLVLVSPCFRENVNVTCKIVSFLCSLGNFLQKNVIVFFLVNQISKWH